MRPLEIALVAADVVAFLASAVPLTDRAARWRLVALLAPVALVAQLAIEGSRWQLVPAQALACLLGGISLARGLARAGVRARRRWPAFLARALGSLAVATAALLPLVFPVFRFPRPGGPYGIGTVTYHWIDTERAEAFAADPAQRRELVVQLWYPATVRASSPRASYVADGGVLAPIARLLRLPRFVFSHLPLITTNAVESAPMAGLEAARSQPRHVARSPGCEPASRSTSGRRRAWRRPVCGSPACG